MAKSFIRTYLLLSIFQFAFAAVDKTNADQILDHSQTVRRIPNTRADAILKTKSDRFNDEKEFTFMRKLAEDGERFKTLTRFKKPLTIKNQAILFLEKDNYENSIIMYLPAYKKVRRVESHSQSSSFMGSAFSYSDIATPLSKDFTNTLVKSEDCPSDKSKKCFVINSKPKTKQIKERTNYSLQTSWINTENFLVDQTLLFAEDTSKFVKKITFSDYKNVRTNLWFCQSMVIEDTKSKKTTTLLFSNLKADQELSNSIFSQQSLSDEK